MNKKSLLKLIADEVKPEIIVSSQDYNSDKDIIYNLTETTAEETINTICKQHDIPYKEFVGLYEDVVSIIKKRIIIS